MSIALKIAALLVLGGGVLAEHEGLIPAPGFALLAGALLAVYLWFLAKARRQLRPPL
jgi:Flp pilus assembly protein TadB